MSRNVNELSTSFAWHSEVASSITANSHNGLNMIGQKVVRPKKILVLSPMTHSAILVDS